jgi:predicted RNA-binding Zn-ribbon protein involved in translation (DUF1610 family)
MAERRKLFGDNTVVARRSLFSSTATRPRRKLFALTSVAPRVMVCLDCGHEIVVEGTSVKEFCPNCGGTRFNIKEGAGTGRRSLFDTSKTQPEDSESKQDLMKSQGSSECQDCGSKEIGKDATDEILKEFSGKSIEKDELQKLFTERGIKDSVDSILGSGYASLNDEGQVCFSECADLSRKMFSELVISVTKELHLVPAENKVEELVDELEGHGNVSPKGIILVKKAHGLIPRGEVSKSFSEEENSYLEDSGLASDLKLEWGGKRMALKEFMDILNTQYNDAPDNILDMLVDSGIIKISGSQVEII